MLRKIFVVFACIAAPAIAATIAWSAYLIFLFWTSDGQTFSLSHFALSKVVNVFPFMLASFAGSSAIITGIALGLRRFGLSLLHAFAIAWLGVTIAGSAVVFFSEGYSGDAFESLLSLVGSNLIFDGIQAGVAGLLYRWLSVTKPKPVPEAAF